MKKKLKKLIDSNLAALNASDKSFKDLYEIIFSSDGVLAEYSDGYRINKLTYAQARKRIVSLAAVLRPLIGGEQCYVGLYMENCPEWIICFWAILMSGGRPYLMNTRYPAPLLKSACGTLGIEHVIGLNSPPFDIGFHNIAELEKSAADNADGEDLSCFGDAMALSTSATSLHEVICVYTGREISEQVLNSEYVLSINRQISRFYRGELKQLAFLPFYHIFGLVAVYFWFTFFGRTFVFLKDYSGDTILKTCRMHSVTHIFAPPVLWHTVESRINAEVDKRGEKDRRKFDKGIRLCEKLQSSFPRLGIGLSKHIMRDVTDNMFGRSVRFCISGGGYLRDSALYMINALGYPLHNGFGMTEAGITSVELGRKFSQRIKNSIGKPFPSVEYDIDGDGVLYIRGGSLCAEIITDSVAAKTPEWFRTGDIAVLDSDGGCYISGRESDLIIGASGENVNPDLIEKQLTIDGAERFCVFGEGEKGDEQTALVVQISRYCPENRIASIAEAVARQNDALALPLRIRRCYFTFDPIASDGAIKVSRKYLARGIASGDIKLCPFCKITARINGAENGDGLLNNPLAEEIREIIAEQLSLPPDDIKPDMHIIFDLNATSLDYFSLIALLNSRFGVELYLEDGKCCYTLREFTKEIGNRI